MKQPWYNESQKDNSAYPNIKSSHLPLFKLTSNPSKLEYESLLTSCIEEGFLHISSLCNEKIKLSTQTDHDC